MGSRICKGNLSTLARSRTAVRYLSISVGVLLLCFISPTSSLADIVTGLAEDESHASCAEQIVADITSTCGYGTSNLKVESDGSILWLSCAAELGLSQEAAKMLLINHTVGNLGGTLQLPQLLQQYAKQARVPLEVTVLGLEQWSKGDVGAGSSATSTTYGAQYDGTADGDAQDDKKNSTATDVSQYAAWALAPSNLSAMVADSLIQPLEELLSLNSALQAYWQDIPQVFRDAAAVYDEYIVGIPYTAETPLIFWRRDVLQLLGVSSAPTSWEETLALARRVHGVKVPCVSDNSTCEMYGFCFGLPDGCFYDGLALTAIWASMVGAYGTKGGLFFDPVDMQPLVSGAAMTEALRILRELYSLAPPARSACRRQLSEPDVERCGIGLSLSNLFKTVGLAFAGGMRGRLGVSLLPGSHVVQNRRSGLLETCTKSLCPYANLENNTLTNQMALVNRVPYLGRGAYSFGLNRRAAPNHALAALRAFTYAITYEDGWPFALDPNTLTMSVRSLHLSPSALPRWTAAGYEAGDTAAFLGVVADSMQHPGLALAPRMLGSVELEAALGRAATEVLYNGGEPAQTVQALHNAYTNMLRDHYGNEISQFQLAYWRDIGFKPDTSTPKQSSVTSVPHLAAMIGGTAGAVGALAVVVVGVLVVRRRRLRIHRTMLHRPVEAPGYSLDTSLCITDIQSSTALWEALEASVMDTALSLHNGCVRGLLPKHSGYECHTEGDSFIIAFPTAPAAVAFALEMQSVLLELPWPTDLLEHEACATVYQPPLSMAIGPPATPSPPPAAVPSLRFLGTLVALGAEASLAADQRPSSASRPNGSAVAVGPPQHRRERMHRTNFGTRPKMQRQQTSVGRALQEGAPSSGLELEGSCRAVPLMDVPDSPAEDPPALPFSAELLALHNLMKRQSGVTLLALRGTPATAPLPPQDSGSLPQQPQQPLGIGTPQAESTQPPSLAIEREEMGIISSCAVHTNPFRSGGVAAVPCFTSMLTGTVPDAPLPSCTVDNTHSVSAESNWLATAVSGTGVDIAMRGLSRTLCGCPIADEGPSTAGGEADSRGSQGGLHVSSQGQAGEVHDYGTAQSRRWLPGSCMSSDGESAVVHRAEDLECGPASGPVAVQQQGFSVHRGEAPSRVVSGGDIAGGGVEDGAPDDVLYSGDASQLGTVPDGHGDGHPGPDLPHPVSQSCSSGIDRCASGATAGQITHGLSTGSDGNDALEHDDLVQEPPAESTPAPPGIGLRATILSKGPLVAVESPAPRSGAETSPGVTQRPNPLGLSGSHSISCSTPRAWAMNSTEPPPTAGLACSVAMATQELHREGPTSRIVHARTPFLSIAEGQPRDQNTDYLASRSSYESPALSATAALPGGGEPRSVAAILAYNSRTSSCCSRPIHETAQLHAPDSAALFIELPTLTSSTLLTPDMAGFQMERSGALQPLQVPVPSRRLSRIASLALGTVLQGPRAAATGSGALSFRGFRVRCGIASGLVPGRDVLYRKATSRRMAYSGACMRLTKLVSEAAVGGMVLLSSSAMERLIPLPRREMPGLVVWHKGRFQLETGPGPEPAPDSAPGCCCGAEDLYQAMAASLAPRQLLLERLALRTGPQLLPGLLAAPMGSVTLALVQVVGLATLMAWDEGVTRGSVCRLHRTALELLRASGGYPAVVQDGRVLAAFTNAPSAVRWLLTLEEELRCVVDWPPQLLEHELGHELTVTRPQHPSGPFLPPIAAATQGHDAGAGLVDGAMSWLVDSDAATAPPACDGIPTSEGSPQVPSWPVSGHGADSEGSHAARRGLRRAAGTRTAEGFSGRAEPVTLPIAVASGGVSRRRSLMRQSAERERDPRSSLEAVITASVLATLGGGEAGGEIGTGSDAPMLEPQGHTASNTSRSLPAETMSVMAEQGRLPRPHAAVLLSPPVGPALARRSVKIPQVRLGWHVGGLSARPLPMDISTSTPQLQIDGAQSAEERLQRQDRQSDLGQRVRSTAATAEVEVQRRVSSLWAECTPQPSRAALEADAAQDAVTTTPGAAAQIPLVQRCVLRGLRVRCSAEEGTFFLDGSVSADQLYGSQHGGRSHGRLVKLCCGALMGQVLCSATVAKWVRRAAAAGEPLAQQLRVTPLPPAAPAVPVASTGGMHVARSCNHFPRGTADGSLRYVRASVAFGDGVEGEDSSGPERTSGRRRSDGPMSVRASTLWRQGFRTSESSGHPKADVWVCSWARGSAGQNGIG